MNNKKTIEYIKHSDCCGCYSCMNICPKDAITMQEDERGFSHPLINHGLCIDCGLCYDRCPVNNEIKYTGSFEPVSYSLSASPEICLRSTSGGAFSLLANQVLSDKGVVFGAKSNGLEEVWHDDTETIEGLDSLRRSKYFQSNIGFTYRKIKKYLRDERKVLFVGTPCQVAGLKSYLGKDYEKLITCDLICHGVPSKAVFRRFVKEVEKLKNAKLKRYYRDSDQWAPSIFACEYEFESENARCPNAHLPFSGKPTALEERSDKKGWKEVEPYDKDWFNQLFHSNLIQRKSCRHCRFCHIPRVGEITLGDDWRYYNKHINEPDNLRLGRSYVIINNKKGELFFKEASRELKDIEPAGYLEGGHINTPPIENPLSELFFKTIKTKNITEVMWDFTTKKTFSVYFYLFRKNPFLYIKAFVNRIKVRFIRFVR